MASRLIPSSVLGANIRRTPLTRAHPSICTPLPSINLSNGVDRCVMIRPFHIQSRRSLATSARLSSLPTSPSPSTKEDAAVRAGSPSKPEPATPHHQTSSSSTPEEEMKISFHDLGMNRITKFVVLAVLSVFGTMETIFWCKVLWRWWTGAEEDE